MAARDKGMRLVNELIGAVCLSHSVSSSNQRLTYGVQVKFMKFFAWEERSIGRALDAMEAEMKSMIMGAASSMEWAYHTIIADNVLLPARVNSVVFTSFGRVPPFWYPLSRSCFCYAWRRAAYQCSIYCALSLFTYTVRSLNGFGCSLPHFLGWVELS